MTPTEIQRETFIIDEENQLEISERPDGKWQVIRKRWGHGNNCDARSSPRRWVNVEELVVASRVEALRTANRMRDDYWTRVNAATRKAVTETEGAPS